MIKKLLTIFILCLIPCWLNAGSVAMVMGGGTPVPAGGGADSCTGNLLFSWHMENVDVTQGTPAGCSVGDTTATAASLAELSTTQAKDGTYSLSVPSSSDRYVFTVSSEDIGKSEAGSIEGWIYVPTSIANIYQMGGLYVDANNFIILSLHSSDVGRIYYKFGGTTVSCSTTDTATADSWWYIKASWSVAGVGGNYLRIGMNQTGAAPSYVNCNTGITDTGSPVELFWGDKSEGNSGYYLDGVKVYGAW